MAQKSYEEQHKVNVATIKAQLECGDAVAESVLALCEAGYRHGLAGYWPNGDFSSDADWCYGPGAEIQRLEVETGDECGSIFDFYNEAWAQGFDEGGHAEECAV